jgi:hypothetical protein
MNLGSFMAAIRHMESDREGWEGNYNAQGRWVKGDRALGAYQIMSKNWPSWSAAAGIPGADWRDPAAQDRVAAYKFQEYKRQYGDWWRVALAWFAGGSVAQHTIDHGYRTPADIKDDGLRKYVNQVMGWQQEAYDAGWDNIVRGDASYRPPTPYMAPDMAAVRNPPPAPNDSQAQLTGMLSSLSNQVAGGQRLDIDEHRRVLKMPETNDDEGGLTRDIDKMRLTPEEVEPI